TPHIQKVLKKYTTGYTNCLPIKYQQNNLYAIAVADHYTGFLKINLSAKIKLKSPLMKRLSQNKLEMVLFCFISD
ncbi:hypothetical protein L4X48_18680, partial [Phocaeicola vulgatus]